MNLQSLSDQQLIELKKQKETEHSQNNNLQMASKILLNSGYGALANSSFLYFRVENAESITTTGQMVNRWSSERTNNLINNLLKNKQKNNYVTCNDTDSMYLEFNDIVKQITDSDDDWDSTTTKLDKFMNEVVSPEIKKQTEELCDYLNNYENKMVWEREVISPTTINVAKKKYAMLVSDSEGVRYDNPKLKVTGLEAKKSSTPAWARKALVECYNLALKDQKQELHYYVEQFEADFCSMSATDIAIPRSVNNIEKYVTQGWECAKGTPKNVRAAIVHNRTVDQKQAKNVNYIVSGDKIKFISLKQPNPTGDKVIGFVSRMPEEFELTDFVDYEKMFDEGFVSPLTIFLASIGWTPRYINTLF